MNGQAAPSRGTSRSLYSVGVILVLVAFGAVGWRVARRQHAVKDDVAQRQQELALGPKVLASRVRMTPPVREVTLPGDVRPIAQTTLYAKISGYLKSIRVDKGDHVVKNQVIAVIESPETDQQVLAAGADLRLRKANAERARRLAPPGVISRQDLDNAENALRDAQSNYDRSVAMTRYEKLRAPFEGTVTARYVDEGALLPAATGSTQSALPIVEIGNLEVLRVYVYLAQDLAGSVHPGDPVKLSANDRPEQAVQAHVTRVSGALDPRTRTMVCEIDIPNHEGAIPPGGFAQVSLQVRVPPRPMVPSEALFNRAGKDLVAVVDNNHVRFVPVKTGTIEARTIVIESGLRGDELVVDNLPAELSDNSPVQAVERAEGGKQ